jgi:septal ring factor EnvC (AmiA/AmiB activator)
MIMSKIISVVKNLFTTQVIDKYPKTFSFVRNLLTVLGIFTTLYLVFFLTVTKPQMIQESEDKIKLLNQEIKDNNKEISKLEKENKKIVGEIGKLNTKLSDLQIKNKKYVKDYEKNIARISTMSNNQLSGTFADAFDE